MTSTASETKVRIRCIHHTAFASRYQSDREYEYHVHLNRALQILFAKTHLVVSLVSAAQTEMFQSVNAHATFRRVQQIRVQRLNNFRHRAGVIVLSL